MSKAEDWKITQINTDNMNVFEHRAVVFTRIKTVGNGKTIPYSQAIQIWDVKNDQLMLTLEPVWEE